jgi:hypothetical protein
MKSGAAPPARPRTRNVWPTDAFGTSPVILAWTQVHRSRTWWPPDFVDLDDHFGRRRNDYGSEGFRGLGAARSATGVNRTQPKSTRFTARFRHNPLVVKWTLAPESEEGGAGLQGSPTRVMTGASGFSGRTSGGCARPTAAPKPDAFSGRPILAPLADFRFWRDEVLRLVATTGAVRFGCARQACRSPRASGLAGMDDAAVRPYVHEE